MKINNSQVVKNLFLKRDLLRQGDPKHEQIRPALLICGGGMRGVYGAGVVMALHQLGLADCFDVVVGISTGAAIGGYFLAGEEQSQLGTSIYYNECLNGFINFWRWPIIDIDYLEKVFRDGPKKLNDETILKHRSKFFVGVTDWDTGEGCFLEAGRVPDPITAIKASLAVTELYHMVFGRKI